MHNVNRLLLFNLEISLEGSKRLQTPMFPTQAIRMSTANMTRKALHCTACKPSSLTGVSNPCWLQRLKWGKSKSLVSVVIAEHRRSMVITITRFCSSKRHSDVGFRPTVFWEFNPKRVLLLQLSVKCRMSHQFLIWLRLLEAFYLLVLVHRRHSPTSTTIRCSESDGKPNRNF